MAVGRLIAILILLILNLMAAIFLQTKLANYFNLELIFVILLIIIGIILLIGIGLNARWVWPITTLYFAASMANLLFLFLSTDAIITFLGGIFVNLIGMMIAILSITRGVESNPMESYNLETPQEVTVETKTTRRRRRR